MIRYLLFDLDGTLLDTHEVILRTFEYTLKTELGIKVKREEILKIFGQPLLQQMSYFSSERAESLSQTYREYYATIDKELTKPFPGVSEILTELSCRKISVGVVTNKGRVPTERALKNLGLLNKIDFIIAGDDVKNPKPHPEALFLALDKLNSTPSETLMIGDSPLDIEAAHRAGVKSALVNWTIFPEEVFAQYPPDFILNQMSDLFKILKINVA